MPWSSKIAVTNGIRRTPKHVVLYGGEHKPAVDAAVQLAIYKHCPRINFMIHAHVNIKDALTTATAVPRGGFEEIDEILSAVGYTHRDGFALNLKGHGCLIGVERLEDFKNYWGAGIPNAITPAV
jgi:ribulose-5-phosphate 4-epimerase/fuculose-1-phosphate aldolase